MTLVAVARLSELAPLTPTHAQVAGVDLVLVRFERDGATQVSALFGRCLHRGALMSDGRIEGDNLICGLHDWDYRFDTGVSEYNPSEVLQKFDVTLRDDQVWVDEEQVATWAIEHPQPFADDAYQGRFQDLHGTPAEPHVREIRELAEHGLSRVGHHGTTGAMGVSRENLPVWDDLQLATAQLARKPLLDEAPVATKTVIGPRAKRPLELDIPLFVSDMSYGALSAEAKVALSMGAELAGTGICSGEGGMLPEEQQTNRRYFYELASAQFGWSLDKAELFQAFHFKGGQGAKTGTGGHLPGHKVDTKIAEVRGLEPGQAAISPATFPELEDPTDFRAIADRVRARSGGVPIGFKLSAQHVEEDIDYALEASADYIILDGRGGGTGAAPLLFRDHISVPTMAAIARARRHLDRTGHGDVTLIATGGLRTAPDFAKAMALGADAIAVSNSALQAIGCLGMRACHTNNCPVGIATQKQHLRDRLPVKQAAERLERFFGATVELMQVLARACGHDALAKFEHRDLISWKREVAELTGVRFAGVGIGRNEE